MMSAFFNWVRASWDAMRTSLWMVPAVMFFLGIALAFAALRLGSLAPGGGATIPEWLRSGSGEDARNLLSTLLSAVIGMASIVFSITVVSLSLAANAYGPRLIRTFRSSRSTQLVIGVFMMTIVYLLLVLRAVRGEADAAEVPDAAVALGSLLALLSVLALLSFIHGVATLMVSDEVVRRVRIELDTAIGRLPEFGADRARAELPGDFDQRAERIRLPREGYVQSVQFDKLVEWAKQSESILRLDFRPGDFVVEGDHKLLVYPPPGDPEAARREIDRYIASGHRRTPTQDIEFAIRYLVEVAVRALSPGINDPFTAMSVIDRLRGGLARLSGHDLPAPELFDGGGRLRLVRDITSYRGIVDAAFHQIRQAASKHPSVLVYMVQAIGAIAEHTRTAEQRQALIDHAQLIMNAAERELEEKSDLEDVAREYRKAVAALSNAA